MSGPKERRHAYAGIAPCGCVIEIVADYAALRPAVGAAVAEMIADHDHVEWMPADVAGSRYATGCGGFGDCVKTEPPAHVAGTIAGENDG